MLRRERANKSGMYGYREICLQKLFTGRRTISVMRSFRFFIGTLFLFFRYITKKPQAHSKKDMLAVFWLRLFFHSSVFFIHFLKNATTTAPGPHMGPDNASDGRVADFFQVTFPDMTAVLNIFQQQCVRDSAVAKQNRFTEINAADPVDFLNEQIVTHFRAARFSEQPNFPVNDG